MAYQSLSRGEKDCSAAQEEERVFTNSYADPTEEAKTRINPKDISVPASRSIINKIGGSGLSS